MRTLLRIMSFVLALIASLHKAGRRMVARETLLDSSSVGTVKYNVTSSSDLPLHPVTSAAIHSSTFWNLLRETVEPTLVGYLVKSDTSWCVDCRIEGLLIGRWRIGRSRGSTNERFGIHQVSLDSLVFKRVCQMS